MKTLSRRKLFTVITAVLCIVVFAVLMFIARDPSLLKSNKNDNILFQSDDDFIRFIDVGQGDCALIYSDGYSAVVDLGVANASDDIIDTLNACEIKAIDMVIISHYHSDHIGAFDEVAESYEIKNMIGPQLNSTNIKAASEAKKTVLADGGNFY